MQLGTSSSANESPDTTTRCGEKSFRQWLPWRLAGELNAANRFGYCAQALPAINAAGSIWLGWADSSADRDHTWRNSKCALPREVRFLYGSPRSSTPHTGLCLFCILIAGSITKRFDRAASDRLPRL